MEILEDDFIHCNIERGVVLVLLIFCFVFSIFAIEDNVNLKCGGGKHSFEFLSVFKIFEKK